VRLDNLYRWSCHHRHDRTAASSRRSSRYPTALDICRDVQLLEARNDDGVKGLKIFCIGANLSEFILEMVRIKMWGLSLLIVAVPLLAETIFSIIPSERSVERSSRDLP
jgi:hypothetical protein